MPTEYLKYFYSGGADNADPMLSLGGVKSSVEVNPNALFDAIHYNEAWFGDSEWRCIYAFNTHTTDSILDLLTWAIQGTLVGGGDAPDTLNIQFDPAGIGNGSTTGVATDIVDEDTAPDGVVFPETPPTAGEPLASITLGPLQGIGLWLQWDIVAGTALSYWARPFVHALYGM